MKDTETKEKFIELRAKGQSFDRIATELNVSRQTLINWSKEYKMEIVNRKSLELDVLKEKYALSALKRLALHGEILEKLNAEFKIRDLSILPTEKLYDAILKASEILKKEEMPIEFHREEKQESTEELLANMKLGKVHVSWEA